MAQEPGKPGGPRRRGRRTAPGHVPGLAGQVMRFLKPAPGETVADCTLGCAGHAIEFLKRVGPGGRLIGLDIDGTELERARRRLARSGQPVHTHRRNFAGLPAVLAAEHIDAVDIIFADLGTSGMQVDDPSRGIGYKADGPLDMRMDDRLERTGADLLARLSAQELSDELRELSDEPDHQRIAEWIISQRQVQPIARVEQLVRLVLNAKGMVPRTGGKRKWNEYGPQHPAARTFQALRILVNHELENLESLLAAAPSCLRPGGRIGVVSFHSGEDRLVKRAFRDGQSARAYSRIAAKPVTPTPAEVRRNPRSASAKFRWARK